MIPPVVKEIVQEYVEAAAALRANTTAITPSNGSVPDNLDQLRQERDEIYKRWKAASEMLLILSIEYKAYAVSEIEKLREV